MKLNQKDKKIVGGAAMFLIGLAIVFTSAGVWGDTFRGNVSIVFGLVASGLGTFSLFVGMLF